ncbi:MAG: YceI family protein [Deltaproteobacteria bacterium]|nr:YceI family protein [Deltaproteobacteria bacterium]
MQIIRRLVVSLAALGTLASSSALAAPYEVDGAHSSVLFKVMHFGIAPFHGRFNKVAGTFEFDGANVAASKLAVDIDANSVFTADKKRDDHLKSPDFFNAKQFPNIVFKSRAVKAGARAGAFLVEGDLTLRGVTKPVTVELVKTGEGKDPYGGYRVGFEGTFTINRHDFGVSFMPDGLGKDVTITVAVQGVKKG